MESDMVDSFHSALETLDLEPSHNSQPLCIGSLPHELLDLICSFLTLEDSLQLSRCSRLFHNITARYVYEKIDLYWSNPASFLERLQNSLQQRSSCHLVRHVSFSHKKEPEIVEIHHIHELWSAPVRVTAVPQMSSVLEMRWEILADRISSSKANHWLSIRKFLASLPRLQTFRVESEYIDKKLFDTIHQCCPHCKVSLSGLSFVGDSGIPLYSSTDISPLQKVNLRSLSLQSSVRYLFRSWPLAVEEMIEHILCLLPSLEDLKIRSSERIWTLPEEPPIPLENKPKKIKKRAQLRSLSWKQGLPVHFETTPLVHKLRRLIDMSKLQTLKLSGLILSEDWIPKNCIFEELVELDVEYPLTEPTQQHLGILAMQQRASKFPQLSKLRITGLILNPCVSSLLYCLGSKLTKLALLWETNHTCAGILLHHLSHEIIPSIAEHCPLLESLETEIYRMGNSQEIRPLEKRILRELRNLCNLEHLTLHVSFVQDTDNGDDIIRFQDLGDIRFDERLAQIMGSFLTNGKVGKPLQSLTFYSSLRFYCNPWESPLNQDFVWQLSSYKCNSYEFTRVVCTDGSIDYVYQEIPSLPYRIVVPYGFK